MHSYRHIFLLGCLNIHSCVSDSFIVGSTHTTMSGAQNKTFDVFYKPSTVILCVCFFFGIVLIEVFAQTLTSKFVKRANFRFSSRDGVTIPQIKQSKRVPNKTTQRGLGIGMFFLNTCQIIALVIIGINIIPICKKNYDLILSKSGLNDANST